MRIKEIVYQHRRDFDAIFECEHCGYEKKMGGYDDANFHNKVIPDMACPECGKKASENYRPLTTKYPEGVQV
jgi:ribosomal protein L37AE/L43A